MAHPFSTAFQPNAALPSNARFTFATTTRPQSTIFQTTPAETTPRAKQSISAQPFGRPNTPELPQCRIRKPLDSAPSFGDSSFTVLVGPADSTTRFSLHKDLAVNESTFFELAFRNDWKESSENLVRLPDHEAEHFQIFFLWLYTRQIFSLSDESCASQECTDEWDRLGHAWALGSYLEATDFKDAVTDAILERASQASASCHSIHETIYANSIAGTPIRKLAVDIAMWRWDTSILEAQGNNPAWSDFFRDLSIALFKARAAVERSTVVKPSCDYHEHLQKGTSCYKKKQLSFCWA